jgi:hypothetical protein
LIVFEEEEIDLDTNTTTHGVHVFRSVNFDVAKGIGAAPMQARTNRIFCSMFIF